MKAHASSVINAKIYMNSFVLIKSNNALFEEK